MSRLYRYYLRGFYQEVYDELMTMQEQIVEDHLHEDALYVAKEIMKRIRSNIELLLPRLQTLGYQFGKGFWSEMDDISPREKAEIEKDIPLFQAPDTTTPGQVARLEQLTGPLPLSLKSWYEEVGSVNLIGLFAPSNSRHFTPKDGCILDPLFVYSVEMAIKMVTGHIKAGAWKPGSTLSLSPDKFYKYSFSGAGTYSIQLPCKSFDALLLGEQHHTTFINYLRICFRWGGFPGLEEEQLLPPNQLAFLTAGMLPF